MQQFMQPYSTWLRFGVTESESVQTRLLKFPAGRAIQYLSVNNLCLSIITAFSFLCCCLYLKKALHFLF